MSNSAIHPKINRIPIGFRHEALDDAFRCVAFREHASIRFRYDGYTTGLKPFDGILREKKMKTLFYEIFSTWITPNRVTDIIT